MVILGQRPTNRSAKQPGIYVAIVFLTYVSIIAVNSRTMIGNIKPSLHHINVEDTSDCWRMEYM
eukprot:11348063-Ditylum_brightwellii.AAC.1